MDAPPVAVLIRPAWMAPFGICPLRGGSVRIGRRCWFESSSWRFVVKRVGAIVLLVAFVGGGFLFRRQRSRQEA
jgi:hypothetical protein